MKGASAGFCGRCRTCFSVSMVYKAVDLVDWSVDDTRMGERGKGLGLPGEGHCYRCGGRRRRLPGAAAALPPDPLAESSDNVESLSKRSANLAIPSSFLARSSSTPADLVQVLRRWRGPLGVKAAGRWRLTSHGSNRRPRGNPRILRRAFRLQRLVFVDPAGNTSERRRNPNRPAPAPGSASAQSLRDLFRVPPMCRAKSASPSKNVLVRSYSVTVGPRPCLEQVLLDGLPAIRTR